MWTLDNQTPGEAERNWVRDVAGRHHWLVAVQVRYDVAPDGTCTPAEEQAPPPLQPEYRGEDGNSSLVRDGELSWRKPGIDVLVEGSAHAPGGQPRASTPVALRCPGIDKTLLVRGDAVFVDGVSGLTTTAPSPFTTLPLSYERAFGGFDQTAADPNEHRLCLENPVGRGFVVRARTRLQTPAPNVVDPKDPMGTTPVGFGALASYWAPRAAYAGTYDAAWVEHRKPLLPTDFDLRFSMSAPADQQLPRGALRGGSKINVVHMNPRGVFAASMPPGEPTFVTRFGARRQAHAGSLSTVYIEPDLQRLSLVWQSHVVVPPSKLEALDETTIDWSGS